MKIIFVDVIIVSVKIRSLGFRKRLNERQIINVIYMALVLMDNYVDSDVDIAFISACERIDAKNNKGL